MEAALAAVDFEFLFRPVEELDTLLTGLFDGAPLLDLCYEEDVRADTDMNVVCTGDGRFVEVQGTAEAEPFDRKELGLLLDLASSGCAELATLQTAVLEETLTR